MLEKWIPVSSFGDGTIYAQGDKRKIVSPGKSDFDYLFEKAQLVKGIGEVVAPVNGKPKAVA